MDLADFGTERYIYNTLYKVNVGTEKCKQTEKACMRNLRANNSPSIFV